MPNHILRSPQNSGNTTENDVTEPERETGQEEEEEGSHNEGRQAYQIIYRALVNFAYPDQT
jgi:hypothetical protein